MKYSQLFLIATVWCALVRYAIFRSADTVSGKVSQPNMPIWDFSFSPILRSGVKAKPQSDSAIRDTNAFSIRSNSDLQVFLGMSLEKTIEDGILLKKEHHEDSSPFGYVFCSSTISLKKIFKRSTTKKSICDGSRPASKAFRKLYAEISDEFQVNTLTDGLNTYPFPVIFDDYTQGVFWSNSEESIGIQGQIFDIYWNKAGTQFEVSTFTTEDSSSRIRIAVLASGHYVVCWRTTSFEIYARIFDKNVGQGLEFQVNSSSYTASNPDIVATDGGGFAILWDYATDAGNAIYTQLFDDQGYKIGNEFAVTSSTSGDDYGPRIAHLANGNMVLTWQGTGGPNSWDIFAEILDTQWNPVVSKFVVNTHTNGAQVSPGVAALKNGGFVVSWSSDGQDGSVYGVFAQMFDSAGNKMANEFQVNQNTLLHQFIESITALSDGGFLISFRDDSGKDGNRNGVFVRRYDQDGYSCANEFQVNQHSDGEQLFSDSAAFEFGFIVAWQNQFPTASDENIFARVYYDPTPSLRKPLKDLNLYQFQTLSFFVPAYTFYNPFEDELTYSARVLIDGEEVLMDSFWLNFDPNSRAFTGTPTQQQAITVQIEAFLPCGGSAMDEFLITVAANSKPVVNALIPNQPIPLSTEEIWEYFVPKNTFKDLEGDPIIFTSAVAVINGEEKDLDIIWKTLDFDIYNGKFYGIPNLSGHFTIRIYADDGLGDLNPTPLDMTVEIISQGIQLLELYRIPQRGCKGFISSDDSYFWIAEGSDLKRFDLSSDNPLLITPSSLNYSFSSSITALAPISRNRMVTGDHLGNIKLLSSSTDSQISSISVNAQVTDIYNQEDEFIYVSHASFLSIIWIKDQSLELYQTISLPKSVTSIAKTGDIVYAGTQNGLFLVDALTNTSSELNMPNVGYVFDLQIFETYLYVLGEYELLILDVSDPLAIYQVNIRSLEGLGTSLVVSKIDGDVIVFISEGENGVSLINASNPLNLFSEGYYSSISSVNWFCISSTEKWGLVLKESEVFTVEIFRRKIQLEVCDTNSDACSNQLEIQAQKDFSKDIKVSESLPIFKADFIYGLSYTYTVLQVSGSVYQSAPEWLSSSIVESKVFRIAGQGPEYLIGSVVNLEVQAFALKNDGEKLLTLKKVFSLSIAPRHASLGSSIPDQSLQVGEEWVFSFEQSAFPDADFFECEYYISSEWIKSYDSSLISFTGSLREWHISYLDSTKENFFGCNPCDDSEYSAAYIFNVTAKNSASDSDPGVSTTFNLYIYSGRIPDQQTHPGISKTIILDESIFPSGIDYMVSLLDSNGKSQSLPWWMFYISNERKILMFPTASEIDQDFDIQISGNTDGEELVSQFTIQVRNEAPVAIKQIQNQRVKLGQSFDFSIPSDIFSDSDGDSLSYTVHWHKEDGTLTAAIPSWITFSESTLTFYGSPSVQQSYTLLVSANDGLGGQASTEFVIEAYNNSPLQNPESSFQTQIDHHIGVLFSLTLPPDLFRDEDGDSLSYSALQSDGSSLPSWLIFNPSTLLFSGTPSDPSLIGTSFDIRVSANDGYSNAYIDLSFSITNSSPSLMNPLNSQIDNSLNLGFIKFKPEISFEFTMSRDTFSDSDNDALTFSSRLSNGDPLPQWLSFDSYNQQFFGTPSRAETLSISVTASDGYSSVSDTFEMKITNQPPNLNKPLQKQVDSLYPDPLVEGLYFSFQFSEDSFIDEDDSLSYSVLFSENGGEWRNLEFSWLELEGRTLSGTVSTISISNNHLALQITASDGQESVSDTVNLTILSPLPSPSASTIHIESANDSIELEVFTNGPKIAVFGYGTLSISDTSNNEKTHWKITGSPSDINYVLERVKYRPSSDRLLSESKVSLRMNGIEQEYPLSVFELREPMMSSPIPKQMAYMDDSFNMGIKKYFNYSDESQLTYSFAIQNKPDDSKEWLSFETKSLSGIPTYSGDIGSYKLQVIATDEFDESESESFSLEVDYTTFSKLVMLIILMTKIIGSTVTLIGLFVYRAAIWNLLTGHRKLHAPLALSEASNNIRELLILRPDEEKIARKIFRKLKYETKPEQEELISDIVSIIRDMNMKEPSGIQRVHSEDVDKETDKLSNDAFKQKLQDEDAPIVKIKEAEYHARFLFFCIMDYIYKRDLNKLQRKQLDNLAKGFKQERLNQYKIKEMAQYKFLTDSELTKCKDTWTINMPDLTKSLTCTCEEVSNFFLINCSESNINSEIFMNRMRIEQWKDRAIRIDGKSSLVDLELYQQSLLCCKLPKKNYIKDWVHQNWFFVNISNNELVMKFDISENPISEKLFVRVLDKTGYLIYKMMILPKPDQSNLNDLEQFPRIETVCILDTKENKP